MKNYGRGDPGQLRLDNNGERSEPFGYLLIY